MKSTRPSARREGAVAAPTAGLHFTPELFAKLDAKGIERVTVTLHVGAGTFLPVKADRIRDHVMHAEWGGVPAEAAEKINAARKSGHRIVAVGTTSLRVLETTRTRRLCQPLYGRHGRFHLSGYRFKCVDVYDDELPFAEIDAAHAGVGLRGACAHSRGLCARPCATIPVILMERVLLEKAEAKNNTDTDCVSCYLMGYK